MEDIKKNAPGTESEYLIEVKNLVKWFPIKSSFFRRTIGNVRAVDGISFHIKRGQTMGLVGESGCGKSTAGRTILRLIEKTSGEVIFAGHDEVFEMKHTALSREVFASGAIAAAKFIATVKAPGMYDMDDLLRDVVK